MPNKNYEVKIATYVIVFGSFLSIIFLSCDKIQGGKTKEQGQQDSIVAKIEGEVALAVLGKQEPDLENLALKEADLSVYIGEYANLKEAYVEDDTVLIMQYEDDKNHLYRAKKNNTSKGLKLYFLGNHTFASKKYPMDRIVFDINTQGKVVGFRDYYNGLYMQMGKRIK